MTKVIRVGNNAYFINKATNQKQQHYEKNDNVALVAKLDDGSTLTIDNCCIKTIFDGQQVFEYDSDTRYIIDDGFQNLLIRCGYIVMNDYDTIHIDDKVKGFETRRVIFDDIKSIIKDEILRFDIDTPIDYKNQSIEFQFTNSGYLYTFCFDTVSNIVTKNQQRKINDLVYYPFEKNMDKYGTMYLSVFCQKLYYQEQPEKYNKYELPEDIIKSIIFAMNQLKNDTKYRFYNFIIKRRINYCKGM